MKIGAIAKVLKNVWRVGKWRLTNPGGALTTHLSERVCGTIGHPGRHIVAADATERVTALGHFGRRIMRAARAKVGNPFDGLLGCCE